MNTSTKSQPRFVVGYLGVKTTENGSQHQDFVVVDNLHLSGFATIVQHAHTDESAQLIADEMNRREVDMNEVAALPQHQQRHYFRVQQQDPDCAHNDLLARAKTINRTLIVTLFSDEEIIEILTDCKAIDEATGRVLGTWELMRLDQRDMIRRGVAH